MGRERKHEYKGLVGKQEGKKPLVRYELGKWIMLKHMLENQDG
jgi:hypothetical protein